jgi:excisionase family DNA binding protein
MTDPQVDAIAALREALRPIVHDLVRAELAAAIAGDRLLDVEEAAEQLGVGRSKVYQLIGSGDLASIAIGTRRKVSRAAVDAYIAARSAQ